MKYSILTGKSQSELETYFNPTVPGRREYGALPFFTRRKSILSHLLSEEKYFKKHRISSRIKSKREPKEAIALFEMKFGVRLSVFAKEILRSYPHLRAKGKIINMFGLSGSGKSTVVEVIRKMRTVSKVVIIDDDAARYGLFAKLILDVETKAGTTLHEIRQHMLHNAISRTFYLLLDFITRELRLRGYIVVRVSTTPLIDADELWYVEHPDGINPRTLKEADIAKTIQKLIKRTDMRVAERDNYPWKKARCVVNFSAMHNVMLRLSERVHKEILLSLKRALLDRKLTKRIRVIKNPHTKNLKQRNEAIRAQLRAYF